MVNRNKKNNFKIKKNSLLMTWIILFILVFIFILSNNIISNKINISIIKTSSNKSVLTENQIEIQESSNANNKSELDEIKNENDYVLSYYRGLPVIAKLEIPKINLITDVLKDYSEDNLKISVTKFYKGLPNEEGNFCIAGHNYIVSNMFHNLKRLEIGDMIYLTDRFKGKLEYYIFEKQIVNPKDVNCLSQETEGNIELTLITCTIDSMNRIIIKARVNGY